MTCHTVVKVGQYVVRDSKPGFRALIIGIVRRKTNMQNYKPSIIDTSAQAIREVANETDAFQPQTMLSATFRLPVSKDGVQ